MTRSAEDLSRDEHIDLKVLVEYIKNDMFPQAKFVLVRMNGMWVDRFTTITLNAAMGELGCRQ
jgi:hypothetical protein